MHQAGLKLRVLDPRPWEWTIVGPEAHLHRGLARWRSRRQRRRGQTLVYFALFLFGFMALAALVIDVGFARLAQRQLQSAADSAALEGLRGAGTLDYGERQAAAGSFVAWPFDDQPVYKPVAIAGASVDPDQFHDQFHDQFQVTLQRGGTDAPAADLYSLGPAVPFLFARGSLTDRAAIQRGITVRGTAVARAERALSVGLAHAAASPVLPGMIPLALDLSYWNSLTSGLADTQPVVAGEVGTVGRFFALDDPLDTLPVAVGRTLPAASQPLDGNYIGYVPIYAAIPLGASSTPRVVGFGQVNAEVTPGAPPQVAIVRQPMSVAQGNAAGVVCYRVALTADEMDAVLALNRTIADPLLAPVSGSVSP